MVQRLAAVPVPEASPARPPMRSRPLTRGFCLLCRHTKDVFWIGPVEHDGQRAPAYACEDCCAFVRAYINQSNRRWDQRPAMP